MPIGRKGMFVMIPLHDLKSQDRSPFDHAVRRTPLPRRRAFTRANACFSPSSIAADAKIRVPAGSSIASIARVPHCRLKR
jgi:hypothetical protein